MKKGDDITVTAALQLDDVAAELAQGAELQAGFVVGEAVAGVESDGVPRGEIYFRGHKKLEFCISE
jgi:hypothetical protein